MVVRASLLSLSLTTLLASSYATSSCSFSDASQGTSFDASPLINKYGYNVTDLRAGLDPSKAYQYSFGICSNFSSFPDPPLATGDNPCAKRTWPISPAYQFGIGAQTKDECYQLSSPYAEPTFSYYDSFNPSRGVVVKMPMGETDFCYGGSHRFLGVALDCTPGLKSNIPDVEMIKETNNCQYEVYLQSHWGCPLECMDGSEQDVCGNHGICGFNNVAKRSECFCDTGYEGQFCRSKASHSGGGISTEAAFLIVAVLLLVFVVVLTVFMFIKLRRLQVDPNAYGELKGRFNELGMIM